MGWVDSLKGSIIGLDTTPLIYFTEENPSYIEVIDPFFKAGAAIFLINDIRLPSLPELKVLALDTLKAQTESPQ